MTFQPPPPEHGPPENGLPDSASNATGPATASNATGPATASNATGPASTGPASTGASGTTTGTAPTTSQMLKFAGRTDPGLMRSNNEDAFTVGPRLVAVADGMGGHAAGEVASRLVVDALSPLNSGAVPTDIIGALDDAVRTGNTAIAHLVARHPELEGMGTTVTALLFDGPHVALAHVGDSRGYLYRSGVLHQLTHDDTFVQSLVDEGRITEQQAHEHPQRNLVLRALTGLPVEPLLTARETAAGDRFLLCSDGLCGVVGAEAIADALAEPDADRAADTLIDLALAAGGPDNVTVVVVDVEATGGRADVTAPQPAIADDPSSTSPIAQLTREMPRVPLPPIPEEPGAEAEMLDEETDLDDDEPDDDTAGDIADDGETKPMSKPGPARRRSNDRGPGSAKRRWNRRGALLVAALVVLVAAGVASTSWVRHQYYVSDQGNLVVVFRGVDGSLLGWSFSTFEETSCAGETDCSPMKVSDLQPAARNQVHAGIKATSLEGARTVVERLSEQLLPPCPDQPGPAGQPPTASGDEPLAPTTGADTSADPGTHTGAGTSADPGTHTDAGTSADPGTHTGAATGTPEMTRTTQSASPAPESIAGTGSEPSATTLADATDLPPAAQVPGVTCRTIT